MDNWVEADKFGTGRTKLPPEEMVPRTLYLPDGRTVPVCVVQVDRSAPDQQLLPAWVWPKTVVGGGFPLISSTQGQENTASVGTLVTDGHTVFALTSRHVAGPAGHPVATILGGRQVDIGHSTDQQLTRLPFTDVYPDFPARRTYLTLTPPSRISDANQVAVDRTAGARAARIECHISLSAHRGVRQTAVALLAGCELFDRQRTSPAPPRSSLEAGNPRSWRDWSRFFRVI